jgi:rare lipoprotein A
LLRYLKNLKIDLIITSLAVAALLTLSGTAVVVVPTLTTPVMAAPTAAAPIPVPPTPLPVVSKPRPPAMPTVGIASWYGLVLQGHHTASGERFNPQDLTAAHRTLPFGTLVRVVDLNTGRSVVVRINDRGVLFPERVIDLSSAAAQDLGILREGIAKVRLEVLKKTPPEDSKTTGVPKPANTETAAL